MGFDLYATQDGHDFFAVTRNGFGDIFDMGARTLEATPYGLFLGTANAYYGTRIWHGVFGEHYDIYLPLVQVSDGLIGEKGSRR